MPSKSKRALISNPYWDTLGGGERYVSTFAKFLLSKGWSVDILWPEDFSSRLYSRFGIELTGVNWLNRKYTPSLSVGYDLLFWLSDGSLPVSLARNTIAHLQFPFKNIGGRSLPNKIKTRLYKFVVNSQFTKKHIDAEFGVDSRVIYPPIDTGMFSSGKKEKLIIYVGRFSQLTQAKGQSVLIDAFRHVHPLLPDWKLVLAGGVSVGADPKMMKQLKQQAADLPVQFVIDPPFSKIISLYSRSKIFWSASGFGTNQDSDPTRVEHFGMSVVEAMASGCVPVITNLGGHSEIIDHGKNGFLWQDIDQLVNLTVEIAGSKNMSVLAKNARQKSKIFDTSRFIDEFSKIIT